MAEESQILLVILPQIAGGPKPFFVRDVILRGQPITLSLFYTFMNLKALRVHSLSFIPVLFESALKRADVDDSQTKRDIGSLAIMTENLFTPFAAGS
jgi:hypothetical protein